MQRFIHARCHIPAYIAGIVVLVATQSLLLADSPDEKLVEAAKIQFRESRNDPIRRSEAAKTLYPLVKIGMPRTEVLNLFGPPDRYVPRESQGRFINYTMGEQQIEFELDRLRDKVAAKREKGLGIDAPRGAAPAIAPAMAAYLTDYIAAPGTGHQTTLRAGFYPAKGDIVWGEPLVLTFSISNIGNADFEFQFGGDYRGFGRHNRIKIQITDADGMELPDPMSGRHDFGGIVTTELITPGGADFAKSIDLTQFRKIPGPGKYMVECAFDTRERHPENSSGIIIRSRFPFSILERTPERVAAVLDELQASMMEASESDLPGAFEAMARFGQSDAVSRLAAFAKAGANPRRIAALGALPLAPGDAALQVALQATSDPDATIRSAAYSAIGHMALPRGIDVLLEAFDRESSPVNESILLALGSTKSHRALSVLSNALQDLSPLRFTAIAALVRFGGEDAVKTLQQHVDSPDLAFRYQIVKGLVNDLNSPLDTAWLMPILMCRRHNSREWLDSLSMVRIRAGVSAVPVLLSCVDFDIPWSHRNFWVLHNVRYAQGAPDFDYQYDPNSTGSAEQHARNRETLKRLRPLAAPILEPTVWQTHVPLLQTDPPIDFTVRLTDPAEGQTMATVECGFFRETWDRNGGQTSFQPTDDYKVLYRVPDDIRSLLNSTDRIKGSDLSEQQLNDLRALAIPLPSPVVEEGLTLLYIWWQESPEGPIRQRARDELCDCVRAAVQKHHTNHVTFAAAVRKILDAR